MPKQYQRTKTMVMVAMLIALEIVITRFLSFQTLGTRIGFGFIPTSMCAMLFGPYIGGAAAFLTDFLGMLVNSRGGAYFWGYGLSQFLYGFSYGLFLYRKEKRFRRIIPCVLLQTIVLGIGLKSLWLKTAFLPGKPWSAIIISQLPQALIMLPIKIVMIKLLWQYMGNYIEKNILSAK